MAYPDCLNPSLLEKIHTMKTENKTMLSGKLPGPFIIAEIGTNHDQDEETAKEMVKKLANSGCDCVKFQIYEASEIVSGKIKASDYNLEKIYGDISRLECSVNLKTPKKWFPDIIDLALNWVSTVLQRYMEKTVSNGLASKT